MNTNTSEFLKKWGGLVIAVVLIVIIVLVVRSGKHTVTESSDTSALTPDTASSTSPASSSKTPGVELGNAPIAAGAPSSITLAKVTYENPTWSIRLTVQSDWVVQTFFDSAKNLHQLQLSNKTVAIFISKNEAIGLSNDLAYTTSTRTIDGQSVSVKTYSHPNAQFAEYQLFSLHEPDGTYSFLIKNTSTNTTVTDAFIRSIVKK